MRDILRKIRTTIVICANCLVISLFAACGNTIIGDGGKVATPTPVPTKAETRPDWIWPDLDAVSDKKPAATELPAYSGEETLNMAAGELADIFNPFFTRTSGEADVNSLINVRLLSSGADEKKLTSDIAEISQSKGYDGSIIYDFKLKDDIFFSDGVNLTADDVIFTMYVLADTEYKGSSGFASLPIKGMSEYRIGLTKEKYAEYAEKAELLANAGFGQTTYTDFTKEEYELFYSDEVINAAGVKFVQSIVDYCNIYYSKYKEIVNNNEVALGMYVWGFLDNKNASGYYVSASGKKKWTLTGDDVPTADDYWYELVTRYKKKYAELSDAERVSDDKTLLDFMKEAYILAASEDEREEAACISGIEKTSMYSFRIIMSEYDDMVASELNITVAPLHYYGSRSLYCYTKDMFGFVKGDMDFLTEKSEVPLGAGPYVMESCEDGVVTLVRNEYYYKGCPEITYIVLREEGAVQSDTIYIMSENDKKDEFELLLDAVKLVVCGAVDFAWTDMSEEEISAVNNLDGVNIAVSDKYTYGYIGIDADRVNVLDDRSSEASMNLRKAFVLVNGYCRDMPDGTADISGECPDEVIDCFRKAGYVWSEQKGKFVSAPKGAKMAYEVCISGKLPEKDRLRQVLDMSAEMLKSIGITLNITELEDDNELYDRLESGLCDMWAAKREYISEADTYWRYYSKNRRGEGGTGLNYYNVLDSVLDELILSARAVYADKEKNAVYEEINGRLEEWAVEIPVYTNKKVLIYDEKYTDSLLVGG